MPTMATQAVLRNIILYFILSGTHQISGWGPRISAGGSYIISYFVPTDAQEPHSRAR